MGHLYPRLPLPTATKLAEERANKGVIELVSLSDVTHQAVRFAPTGGARVSKEFLHKLQQDVRQCAQAGGYPHKAPSQHERQLFDVACAQLLHRQMNLTPAEAAHITMWAFLTTVLLPDVVRWRHPGDATTTSRFIGGDRGLRRNAFGRLWWRACLLSTNADGEDPYDLLRQLGEDEIVQITERPGVLEYTNLAHAVARAHLRCSMNYPHLTRRVLMREAVKRVRRRIPVICYELLDLDQVQADVDAVFTAAAEVLSARPQSQDSSDTDDQFTESD